MDDQEVRERALRGSISSLPQGPATVLFAWNESASHMRGCRSPSDLNAQEVGESDVDAHEVGERVLCESFQSLPQGPTSALSALTESTRYMRDSRGKMRDLNDQEVGERALPDAVLSLPQGSACVLSARNESASLLRGCAERWMWMTKRSESKGFTMKIDSFIEFVIERMKENIRESRTRRYWMSVSLVRNFDSNVKRRRPRRVSNQVADSARQEPELIPFKPRTYATLCHLSMIDNGLCMASNTDRGPSAKHTTGEKAVI
ncbi:hypothetical protein HETIRDRAFT_121098 [Heterobasidion irregulare TC 32-1]|uniref:Uncharacterized protein n=1 Tax=Heterobasidion irregulare (strain TC 32-1) TaxID=747525 RepID=W4KGB4_HETIT|nr:uncharacterized protein HETIRDRAFT_121098 [Heterobasidion irregulare TC 32-1]ETW84898.1 hypothetical protein HETIRDRAFT_121098 [Heterobasidion irregulare TC 32-1]